VAKRKRRWRLWINDKNKDEMVRKKDVRLKRNFQKDRRVSMLQVSIGYWRILDPQKAWGERRD